MAESKPEAWLRGSIEGFDPLVMPIVHSLIQAREDVEQLASRVPADRVWATSGAASIGFHVRHLGGALDRLFTYARGESLSDAQKAALRAEAQPGDPPATLAELSRDLNATIERAMAQLKPLTREALLEPRAVGRAALPSTTLGLLFHAAEHCTRHAGQAITTAKLLEVTDL
jgi:uncharacterized damage-inducible protein DinB